MRTRKRRRKSPQPSKPDRWTVRREFHPDWGCTEKMRLRPRNTNRHSVDVRIEMRVHANAERDHASPQIRKNME